MLYVVAYLLCAPASCPPDGPVSLPPVTALYASGPECEDERERLYWNYECRAVKVGVEP